MSETGPFQGIPLPKDWAQHIKLAVIHSVSLAHRAITYSRSFAINSSIERIRLAGQLDRIQNENALLREEIRIKDARMGKVRIVQVLARAKLHLGASTVGRIVKEEPLPDRPVSDFIEEEENGRVVTARYPNHVWHGDMTTVPTAGFWAPWTPFCLAQVWPFCWWAIVAIDQFSRTVIGFAVFKKQPTADEVIAFMTKAVGTVGSPPRHLISDQGSQFVSKDLRAWCSAGPRKIKQRFGAIGQYGSIAIVERLMRSIKDESPDA